MSAREADPLSSLAELGLARTLETLERLTREPWQREHLAVERFDGRPLRLESGAYVAAELSWSGACCLLCFPEEDAQTVASAFLFNTVDPGEDFMDRRAELMASLGDSTVAEFANVVVHASANAWANACGKGFLLSAPRLLRGEGPEVEKAALQRLNDRVPRVESVISMGVGSPRLSVRAGLRFCLGPDVVALFSAAAAA